MHARDIAVLVASAVMLNEGEPCIADAGEQLAEDVILQQAPAAKQHEQHERAVGEVGMGGGHRRACTDLLMFTLGISSHAYASNCTNLGTCDCAWSERRVTILRR